MLVFQKQRNRGHIGVPSHSYGILTLFYAKIVFRFSKSIWLLVTSVKTLYYILSHSKDINLLQIWFTNILCKSYLVISTLFSSTSECERTGKPEFASPISCPRASVFVFLFLQQTTNNVTKSSRNSVIVNMDIPTNRPSWPPMSDKRLLSCEENK